MFLAGREQGVLVGRLQIALRLRRYPSPADARGLGEQRLAAFLAKNGYTGRNPAPELLGRLRAGANGRAGELETEARLQIVLALVSALEPVVARISELTIEIRHQLDEHPDGRTFRSLFIAQDSWLCAATMLAEIGDRRERYPATGPLLPMAAKPPRVRVRGKPNTRTSAGRAITASAKRSTCSRTEADTTTPGPPPSTSAPVSAAPATPTPPGSSAVPGQE